mmetsp:Transcript_7369/g.15400  ORF Transcript_7369/g.15400 Transcript_7369/m.15400 type:complete len:288 (+) Transcript_7369:771-1634(+)
MPESCCSSLGRKRVKPPAPFERGTMVILPTSSKPGVRAAMSAWPASWYATSSWRFSLAMPVRFSRPTWRRSRAYSTSWMEISSLLRRAATMAASLRRLARLAPEKPVVRAAIILRSTLESSGLERAWTPRMASRPWRSGRSTGTRRSKRPGRRSASSSTSARLVAAMTTTPELPEKPSISVRIWLSVCSCSSLPPPEGRPPPPLRFLPMASISSMKIMQGEFFFALVKMSRTREAPTPTNISTNSEPETAKKGTPASPATALARRVLPVPGGPSRRRPRGMRAPASV